MGKIKKLVAKAFLSLSTLSPFINNSTVSGKCTGNVHPATIDEFKEIKKAFYDFTRKYKDSGHFAEYDEGVIGPNPKCELFEEPSRTDLGAYLRQCLTECNQAMSDPTKLAECRQLASWLLDLFEQKNIRCSLIFTNGHVSVMFEIEILKGDKVVTDWFVFDGTAALGQAYCDLKNGRTWPTGYELCDWGKDNTYEASDKCAINLKTYIEEEVKPHGIVKVLNDSDPDRDGLDFSQWSLDHPSQADMALTWMLDTHPDWFDQYISNLKKDQRMKNDKELREKFTYAAPTKWVKQQENYSSYDFGTILFQEGDFPGSFSLPTDNG